MAKATESYYCDKCGLEHIKWVGRCTSCLEWNSIKSIRYAKVGNNKKNSVAAEYFSPVTVVSGKESSWVSTSDLIQITDVDVDSQVSRYQSLVTIQILFLCIV
jgi:predicted ATP-dependent serine protease